MNGASNHHSGMDTLAGLNLWADLRPEDLSSMSHDEAARLLKHMRALRRRCEAQAAELDRLRKQTKGGWMPDLSQLPVACLTLSARHRIAEINAKAAELLGDTAANLKNRDFATFVAAASYDDFAGHVRETLASRDVRVCHLKLTRPDRRSLYVQMDSYAVPRDGGASCIQTVITDITEHRLAIEVLGRLAAIVESSDDAVIGKDLNNCITSWNAGAQRIYGYTPEEVIGKPISMLMPAEHTGAVLTMLEELKQGRPIDHHMSVHVAKDGRLVDVSLTISPIKDADGNIIGASTIARDITERRKAADALRASEEHLRSILDASPDAILQVGTDLNVVWVNRAAAAIGAAVGESCCAMYGNAKAARENCAARKAIFEKRTVITTFCILNPDDRQREQCWENVGVPLHGPDGSIKGALLTARDVTARKQAERARLEYEKKLRQQASELVLAEERQRRQLAAALHDNIIQDLAISMLRVEMLREKASSVDRPLLDEFARTLGKVIDETRTMTFDISSPTLYRLGLAAAVDELMDEFLQGKHGICCEFFDDGQAKPLDPDVRVLMFQSIRELLINIVKHAEADEVSVRIEREGGMMRVTVSDNGKGFNVNHTELTMHRTGGFGLFSIRERLDYIGGRMTISSEIGKGSRFSLYAPLKT